MGIISNLFKRGTGDNVNVDEEVFKALPAPDAKAPEPQSRQYSPNDISNAYMMEGLEQGGGEPTRGLD